MNALMAPMEILELQPGESKSLRIEAAVAGEMLIQPRDGRPPKKITALRVIVPQSDKPTFPYYWDITSQTLLAQLAPLVTVPGYRPATFTITKVGAGPAARFTVAKAADGVA